jgi:hypothetical protein
VVVCLTQDRESGGLSDSGQGNVVVCLTQDREKWWFI